MVDDDTTPGLDIGTGFEKEETEHFAERGTDIVYHKEKTVDPATGRIEIKSKSHPICTCGTPHVKVDEDTYYAYRCAECDNLSCPECIIKLQRRRYCPQCVETAYSMDRRVFWFLLYINHDQLDADDLIQVDAVEDGTDVVVDRAASTLSDHGYITDDGHDLSPAGTEALAAGKKLYEDDPDVKSTLETLRVQEVANPDI
ncbi:hypothetical protein [Natrinema salinisoli]|uniref:hypothetical protein n=1 Tax=Natrinema salinisoli TaxID=2878535 RepID=UPI001CF0D24B|nr:hypothetical protein [Natrinema salinisoli]